MKQEESNQGVRDGKLVKTASKKVRETIIAKFAKHLEGSAYVVLDDFIRELIDIKSILMRTRAPSRQYAVALAAKSALDVYLELLLIPRQQLSHTKPEPETSAAAAQELTLAAEDALRVSHVLWNHVDAKPTYEDLKREINKTRNPELTMQLLFSAHSTEDGVNTSSGNTLPTIPAAPRFIASANQQRLTLKVKFVDEDPGQATVVIAGSGDPDAQCLQGLFERRIRLVFDETVLPGFGKLLVLAQAADVEIQVLADVQRGLGIGSAKNDLLQAVESIDEARTRAIIAAELRMMMSVDEELPFEQVPASISH